MDMYAKIPEVFDRFDFEKVQKVMIFLDWTWHDKSVPTIDQLKSCAEYCLYECVRLWEEKGCPATGMDVATGGFEARVNVFSSGEQMLQLLFYVDESHSY